jgi:alpha-galactosidase
VWLTELYHQGEDAFPILDQWIEEKAEQLWAEGRPTPGLGKKYVDLYKRFGAVPIGDTAHWSGASWPLWYHDSEMTEAAWGERPADGWNGYFTHVAHNADEFNRVAGDPTIRVTELWEPRKTREPMINIIESVACDIPRVTFGGNIMNRGSLVPGIPEDFEVEVPALISRRGVQGIQTNGLPPALLAHTLRDRVAPINLELDAYNQGSRELLTQLILMDPWSRSVEQARGFVDAVMALEYHDEMRRHYR